MRFKIFRIPEVPPRCTSRTAAALAEHVQTFQTRPPHSSPATMHATRLTCTARTVFSIKHSNPSKPWQVEVSFMQNAQTPLTTDNSNLLPPTGCPNCQHLHWVQAHSPVPPASLPEIEMPALLFEDPPGRSLSFYFPRADLDAPQSACWLLQYLFLDTSDFLILLPKPSG